MAILADNPLEMKKTFLTLSVLLFLTGFLPASGKSHPVSIGSTVSVGYSSYAYGYPSYSSFYFSSYPGLYSSLGFSYLNYPRIYSPPKFSTPPVRISMTTLESLAALGESKRIAYVEALSSGEMETEPAPLPPEPLEAPEIKLEKE